MRIRQNRRRADALAVFILIVGLVAGLVVGGAYALVRLNAAGQTLGQPGAQLGLVERLVFTVYLTARAGDLAAPASSDPTPRAVTVAAGETADTIAARLAAEGLVADAQLLEFYLRYTGLDQRIEAGDFILRATLTVPQVARALTEAAAREVSVRVGEGWRREQIAAYLAEQPSLNFSADDWLRLTGPDAPPVGAFALYGDRPVGGTLEGFLLPDTYLFRPGATAQDILAKTLAAMDAFLTPAYRSAVAARGLTVYQAVSIAALIEREAAVDDERPVIASVILNRLAIGQALEIDATVQYAIATPQNWWPPVAGLDFRAIADPYNTYYVGGLPAGPIANPSRASLQAVADAAQTDYLFYRALCDGSRRHAFARTYAEHLANACP
ncbi:MAG: endolytic transglycosylase MltG [Anaerolineales bacterium]|nr:endolytic transglycosylase MltG [Anaerolineales bacterium]